MTSLNCTLLFYPHNNHSFFPSLVCWVQSRKMTTLQRFCDEHTKKKHEWIMHQVAFAFNYIDKMVFLLFSDALFAEQLSYRSAIVSTFNTFFVSPMLITTCDSPVQQRKKNTYLFASICLALNTFFVRFERDTFSKYCVKDIRDWYWIPNKFTLFAYQLTNSRFDDSMWSPDVSRWFYRRLNASLRNGKNTKRIVVYYEKRTYFMTQFW